MFHKRLYVHEIKKAPMFNTIYTNVQFNANFKVIKITR